jgi:hypothetical protein
MKQSTTTKTTTTKSSTPSKTTTPKTTATKTVHSADSLEKFKMEAAAEVGVTLKNGYNGNLTSKQAGSIGGRMVKKMIDSYKKRGEMSEVRS